jgi:toxin secretion/phage lysis holin
MKNFFVSAVGVLGSFLTYLVGVWNQSLTTLMILMIADYMLGFILGAANKSSKTDSGGLSSKVGFIGICKKCLIFVWIIIAHNLDKTMGVNYIQYGVIYAFMANELISLVENSTLLGFHVPDIITKSIDILKSKDSETDNSTSETNKPN